MVLGRHPVPGVVDCQSRLAIMNAADSNPQRFTTLSVPLEGGCFEYPSSTAVSLDYSLAFE